MSVITHNMSALNAQRQFGINTNNKAKTVEKLSKEIWKKFFQNTARNFIEI